MYVTVLIAMARSAYLLCSLLRACVYVVRTYAIAHERKKEEEAYAKNLRREGERV